MPKYLVEYTLPYAHVVRVGIEANSAADAEQRAQEAFADATLWDDTPACPLLMDTFEETSDMGVPVIFTATPVTEWPKRDRSVQQTAQDRMAHQVAQQLIALYQRTQGRNEAFIGRDALFTLYQLARTAEADHGARESAAPARARNGGPAL